MPYKEKKFLVAILALCLDALEILELKCISRSPTHKLLFEGGLKSQVTFVGEFNIVYGSFSRKKNDMFYL